MIAYSFVDENKQQALYWRDVGTLDAYYDANMDVVLGFADFQFVRHTAGRCGRGRGSIRRRSLSSASRAARAWR